MYLNFWKKRKDIDLTLSPPASVCRYKGHVVKEARLLRRAMTNVNNLKDNRISLVKALPKHH